jgi:hypothetical protein
MLRNPGTSRSSVALILMVSQGSEEDKKRKNNMRTASPEKKSQIVPYNDLMPSENT